MTGLLFAVGGALYVCFELLWRGYSHWTMFVVGGVCFVIIGLLNEHKYTWDMPLIKQALISAVIITVFEFITGCIVNIWLGWKVWDYSDLPFNLYGQICLYYFLLWIPLSVVGIVLDDWIRYYLYLLIKMVLPWSLVEEREKPHYTLFRATEPETFKRGSGFY